MKTPQPLCFLCKPGGERCKLWVLNAIQQVTVDVEDLLVNYCSDKWYITSIAWSVGEFLESCDIEAKVVVPTQGNIFENSMILTNCGMRVVKEVGFM